MLFLGTTFFSGRHTIDPSPTVAQNIKEITLENSTVDKIFVSQNPDITYGEGYDTWDYDTVMSGDYEDGTLGVGNSGFALSNTDYIIIKVREKGTLDWVTIYAKKVNTTDDLAVHVQDFYRKSNVDYEYMLVSVCNGIENTYVTNEIHSEFNGLVVCDKNNIYGTLYNLDFIDTTRPVNSNIIERANNQYPVVVNNSISDYEQGSASGAFIKFNQDELSINIPEGVKHREEVKKWLNNRRPKILKLYDGRIWLVSVTGSINDTADTINDVRKLSFDWTEIGDTESMEDMYNSGLSDVGKEWWY